MVMMTVEDMANGGAYIAQAAYMQAFNDLMTAFSMALSSIASANSGASQISALPMSEQSVGAQSAVMTAPESVVAPSGDGAQATPKADTPEQEQRRRADSVLDTNADIAGLDPREAREEAVAEYLEAQDLEERRKAEAKASGLL